MGSVACATVAEPGETENGTGGGTSLPVSGGSSGSGGGNVVMGSGGGLVGLGGEGSGGLVISIGGSPAGGAASGGSNSGGSSTGGSGTGGSTPGSPADCLLDWDQTPEASTCDSAPNPAGVDGCANALDCWQMNNCGPTECSAEPGDVCGQNNVANYTQGDVQAKQIFAALCN